MNSPNPAGPGGRGLPLLVVVDADEFTLAALRHDLSGRYGNDYRVVAHATHHAGLRDLESLREAGADVALILADHAPQELDGTAFLSRAQDLHPGAKRALLVKTGDAASLASLQLSAALGRIDGHIHKPWDPPEQLLHPHITELLSEWSRENSPGPDLVRVLGERFDARTHEIRDLLNRNSVPFHFHAGGTDAGTDVLQDLGLTSDLLPVVAIRGGRTLIQPTNVEIAEALGVRTRSGTEFYDLAIIGGGPAGLAAAVNAASEGLHTVVVEREAIGGQAGTSSMIRNYPGFPRGISGAEFARRAYSQAWHFGAEFVFAREVTGLDPDGNDQVVRLGGGRADETFRARAVILATGVSYRRLNVPGVDELVGAGVFYGTAISEAPAMTGQDVFVVGGANSAGQSALHLARYASQVTLLVRGGSLAATMSHYLVEQITRTPNIAVRLKTRILAGKGDHRLEGLVLKDDGTGSVEQIPAVAVFILIGAAPRTEWLPPSIQRDDRGFVLTGTDLRSGTGTAAPWPHQRAPYALETNRPGVFAIGDVRHRSVKRVASAVGEGSMVLSFVHQYLGLG